MKKRYILQMMQLAGDLMREESTYIAATNRPGSYYYTTMKNATVMTKTEMREFVNQNPHSFFIVHKIVASK